jgi:hypothetical protein
LGAGNWGYQEQLNYSPNPILRSEAFSDFCRPTICPRCGAAVYFVRHNGGSVWLDELGWPWPKHGCFNNDLSDGYSFFSTLQDSNPDSLLQRLLGRVIHSFVHRFDRVYVVHTADGRVCHLSASRDAAKRFVDLVLVLFSENAIFLHDASPGDPVRVRNFKIKANPVILTSPTTTTRAPADRIDLVMCPALLAINSTKSA